MSNGYAIKASFEYLGDELIAVIPNNNSEISFYAFFAKNTEQCHPNLDSHPKTIKQPRENGDQLCIFSLDKQQESWKPYLLRAIPENNDERGMDGKPKSMPQPKKHYYDISPNTPLLIDPTSIVKLK
jgi:hypothetical protein